MTTDGNKWAKRIRPKRGDREVSADPHELEVLAVHELEILAVHELEVLAVRELGALAVHELGALAVHELGALAVRRPQAHFNQEKKDAYKNSG